MSITRRLLGKVALGLAGATMLMQVPAFAADKPAPFDKPGVKIALVRYLSTGDFFQAYLSGVEAQSKALGIDLRVLDSRQDAALQSDMVDQAIALGVQGIIIQHGLTESMKDAAQRAVDAGIKVVAFDVNVENPKIPQIEQSDRDLARLALEQAVKDNGESWNAGYVYVAGIAPLDRRNETWVDVKKKYAQLLAGEDPGHNVVVPPTLITQKDLIDKDIKNMEDLSAKLPQFAHADVAMPAWMPNPNAK
ncbi:MAG: hypothetical protein E5Y29_18360 [Mesorhizobium sp.]|nr:MAG: hypothetical protein E5Y29_18360 [Mesorhizobium sp.]